jgi:ankyrin repeat protein
MPRRISRLKHLWDYATQGNDIMVERMLLEYSTPIERINALRYTNGITQNTCLHQASMNGHIQTVLVLLLYGSDVNATNDLETTPLFMAIIYDHHQLIEILIGANADINYVRSNGSQAMHIASDHSDVNMVDLLIRNGAMINQRDNLNQTPLLNAAYRGNIPICQLLLANNADMTAIDRRGLTVRGVALEQDNLALLHVFEAEITRRELARQERALAFAMGMHDPFGNESQVQTLNPEVIRLIGEAGGQHIFNLFQ